MFRRFDIKTEVFFSPYTDRCGDWHIAPAADLQQEQLLFSSRASSAFLIYLDPKHPVNHVRTLTISQMGVAVVGYLFFISIGPRYTSAALSMIVTIAIMMVARAMHPPAGSRAMIVAFQFSHINTLVLFLFAVFLLVLLIFLQRVSVWLMKRAERKTISLNKALHYEAKGEALNRENNEHRKGRIEQPSNDLYDQNRMEGFSA